MNVNRDINTITNIVKYAECINNTIARFGREYLKFKVDNDYQSAIAFYLIQIGELANVLTYEFKKANSEIDWQTIRAFRNRIVHHYGTVDISLIWHIANIEIDSLIVFCRQYLLNNS